MISCCLKRTILTLLGCPQETADGFISGDVCNQLKSACTELPAAGTECAGMTLQKGTSTALNFLNYTAAGQSLRLFHALRKLSTALKHQHFLRPPEQCCFTATQGTAVAFCHQNTLCCCAAAASGNLFSLKLCDVLMECFAECHRERGCASSVQTLGVVWLDFVDSTWVCLFCQLKWDIEDRL